MTTTPLPDEEAARRTRELVAQLWERFRPLAESRVEVIERYVLLAADGSGGSRTELTARTRATEAAHNLAGALGSYGRPEGSALALELEHLLAGTTRTALDDLVRRLRAEVTR